MLDFEIKQDPIEGAYIETSITGKLLLTTPQLNKGTAFSNEERHLFGLTGKLPLQVESLEEQVDRVYQQYSAYDTFLKKNIFLNNLHDKNQVLFYRLVSKHLSEMMPVIYTPIVGTAVKQFSREFRQPRGLYLSYPDRNRIGEILDNRSNPEIDLIVVTDGEGVLGIGDQGIGGIDIPVAKLMVYTLCGGINPLRTLPIQLDVGTNNQELLDDPLYLGWRHKRIRGAQYDEFIEKFVTAVNQRFPHIFLHWEDFSRDNARRNLERFKDNICTFNDDMQGTGVVTVSALLAAVKTKQASLKDQRIVVFGAGTAGTGIADQIVDAMVREGLNPDEARKQFWLLDRPGLLMASMDDLTDSQVPYARADAEVANWTRTTDNAINLLEVVQQVKPTVLIGCSAVAGAFNEEIISKMAKDTLRPIILPLSNPTERCEATPEQIMTWTKGQAMIATGSPFEAIRFQGEQIRIAQCNNAFVFPGLGLGIIAAKVKRLTGAMLWAACQALAENAPILSDSKAPLLPALDDAQATARKIAIAVAKQAIEEGLGEIAPGKTIEEVIDAQVWQPSYLAYKLKPQME